MSTPPPEISVIIPCFNEVGNIEPLLAEIESVLNGMGKTFEVLYVDDCSTDGSTQKLAELTAIKPNLRHLRHVRNLGQSAALYNGFARARGSICITMDGDMQNDPADIPALYAKISRADCVCGIRQRRRDSWVKLISSRVANSVRGAILRDRIKDAGCNFRVVKRDAARNLIAFRALHRFFPTILRIHGYRVIQVPISHRPRLTGVSKYGIGNRVWVGIIDMVAMIWYRARHLPSVMLDGNYDTRFGQKIESRTPSGK